jgi:hypothetical protein
MFKVICVDHVGIACKDLDKSKKFYTEVLGLACTGEEEVASSACKDSISFLPVKPCWNCWLIPLLMAAAQLASTSQRTARAFNIWLCA